MHIERMHKAMECLSEWFNCETAKGKDGENSFDPIGGGAVTDMLKDLAQASKDCAEQKYYECLTEMLKEEKKRMKEEGNDRMGYDNWRYANGQFAPTGSGHYAGYSNPMRGSVHIHEPYLDGNMRMGYDDQNGSSGGRSGNTSSSSNTSSNSGNYGNNNARMGYHSGMEDSYYPSKYGTGYDAYQMAKKHYTETKKDSDRHMMDEKIDETVLDFADVAREMWRDASPTVRQKMKPQIEKLLKEMV